MVDKSLIPPGNTLPYIASILCWKFLPFITPSMPNSNKTQIYSYMNSLRPLLEEEPALHPNFFFSYKTVEIPTANSRALNAFTELEMIFQNLYFLAKWEAHSCVQTTNPYNLIKRLHHLLARQMHPQLLNQLPFSIKS